MKKSLVAVGVVAALGVVWTAGAWFTGKQMEARFADMIAETNAQLNSTAPEAALALSYQNYQRGLFSSHLQLVIQPAAGKESPWLKPGQQVVFDESVDHGPFPFAQLKSFNLLPAMASVSSTLVNNEVSKPLFDAAKGKSPFSAETRVGYSVATDSRITLEPLNYEAEGEKLAFSGGTLRMQADREGKELALSGDIKSGDFDTLNEYNQRVQMSFSNLKTDGSSEMTDFSERIGSQKLSLDKLTIAIEGQQMAVIDGMNLDAASTLSSDRKAINTRLDYTLNSLKLQSQDMGSGKLSLKIDKIDGEAWHQFNQQYQAQMNALAAQPELLQDPQVYQQQMTAAFFGSMPILLKGGPTITVAPLSWKNAKGESTLNIALQLNDPSGATGVPQTMGEEIDRSVKSLDSKLTIPAAMATQLMTQVAQLEGRDSKSAASMAAMTVERFAAMGQQFGLTTREKDNIVSSLQYGAGKITLNGKTMTPEEAMIMFMMARQGQSTLPAQ
ncbi:uncharacterized protein YdgA (DUF945 family) [Enterobacter sp. BIGb0383]|uniref:YdgA family protein n=1 Tax=unclassified Enterobacter TaxID=2608935 RepID=UPI000F486216|nr:MULTISPECIES: YdgA family protein [unclassified Enterobacter]ROP61973.1 uncharacterized protein YdgA (DUF945 family) [Enterobacter sp. BIGb0383]ROS12134.1 uncharacterized protein YdgA (DUF945 family) [Enterobacter sp. BIGb0359]